MVEGWKWFSNRSALGLAFATLGALSAQEASETIRTTANEVVLDFVVRDKNNKVVRDLKANEIEVFEDGVSQKLRNFRYVSGKQAGEESSFAKAAVGADGKPVAVDPLREINLVLFVFGSIQPLNREFARQTALSFVNKDLKPNTFVSALILDQRVIGTIPFTRDRELLRATVNQIASGNTDRLGIAGVGLQTQLQIQQLAAAAQIAGPVASPGPPVNIPGGAPPSPTANTGSFGIPSPNQAIVGAAEPRLSEALLSILQKEYAYATLQQGIVVPGILADICEKLGKLPGRKTLIYLNEGLLLNANMPLPFRRAIATANRNNVSIYGVDVRGLVLASSRVGGHPADRDTSGEGIIADDASDLIRADAQENLRDLAESTGGFLIANTNEVDKMVSRIVEDVDTHYEVDYNPSSDKYDGRFRKLTIKVSRPGTKVQSRSGYFALPLIPGQTVQPYEIPLLRELEKGQSNETIPFSTAAMRFRSGARSQYLLGIEIPTSGLKLKTAPDGKSQAANVSYLALLKDDTGKIVEKFSRELPLQIGNDKMTAFKSGFVTFHENVILDPGHYTFDVAVLDRTGEKIGVKRLAFAAMEQNRPMSNLLVIRSAEPIRDKTQATPLRFHNEKLIPSLSASLIASKDLEIPLYFVAYPTGTDKPAISIQVSKNGQMLVSAEPDLPKTSSDGAAPFLIKLAANGWEPGKYEVQVRLTQGANAIAETVPLVLR
jgi:VWFA-related protein